MNRGLELDIGLGFEGFSDSTLTGPTETDEVDGIFARPG